MQYQISIIIPVLNEAYHIGKLLKYLQTVSYKENISEIIVVDGGSTDGSQAIVKTISSRAKSGLSGRAELRPHDTSKTSSGLEHPSQIILTNSIKGRAKQMNVGAQQATGTILYFLHADSFPPKHFDSLIINEVQQGNKAGCFRMKFDSNHWWLRLASWFTKFNWKACRGGDQSLFISKRLFYDIGGFDERYKIYEDNLLINALYARNQFVVINKPIISSARMYRKHGIWKLQYYYWNIHLKQWLGADANTLYSYYKKRMC